MLSQFRLRYPSAALISEFVMVDRADYIVRVSVVMDGVILAAALGVGESVELAEEQARRRAIEILPDIPATTKVPTESQEVAMPSYNWLPKLPKVEEEFLAESEVSSLPAVEVGETLPVKKIVKKDLSEELTKIIVQIRRLGWTPEQGRKYLTETYHKSSTQDLDENELLSFRLYLESLPDN